MDSMVFDVLYGVAPMRIDRAVLAPFCFADGLVYSAGQARLMEAFRMEPMIDMDEAAGILASEERWRIWQRKRARQVKALARATRMVARRRVR